MDYTETLEDLLCRLESVGDTVCALRCAIEDDRLPKETILNSIFAVYSHVDLIAKAMYQHLRHIPVAVMNKAAEEVAKA